MLPGIDGPPDLMIFHLWADGENKRRVTRGQAINVDTNTAAHRAYERRQTLLRGRHVEKVVQEFENPRSDYKRRSYARVLRKHKSKEEKINHIERRRDRLRRDGQHEVADNLRPIVEFQNNALQTLTTLLNRFEYEMEKARKRGRPRHKIAPQYFGLALAPLIQEMIGDNQKLVFRTSSTRGSKDTRDIAESNFSGPAGRLLKLLVPSSPVYTAARLMFSRRDLDWIKAKYERQPRTDGEEPKI